MPLLSWSSPARDSETVEDERWLGTQEGSPSPVYGAGLLIPLGRKALEGSNPSPSATTRIPGGRSGPPVTIPGLNMRP